MQIRLKVKHRDSVEVIVGAVIDPRSRPQAIIAGLPLGGRLRIVGRSTQLSARAARELAPYLREPARQHPWPEVIGESMLNRFTRDRQEVRLTLVEPFVVEVSADVAWTGNAFRHPIRFVRVRPELHPTEIRPPR